MKTHAAVLAASCLFFSARHASLAWDFAVWPGADASQWAPSLGLTNVIGIAAGTDRTLFIRADGSVVWSWGNSWSGSTNVVKASSYCHDLVLLADSTVVEWGLSGCAGSGPYTTMPPGLSNITAIAAGDRHSLVLKADGTCVSWGWMTVGPGYVPDGLSNVVAIAAGFDISSALKSDGSVVAWGDPEYGGTAAPGGLTDGVAIAMGHHHGLVLRRNGTVAAWGTTPPPDLTNVVKIAAQQTWSLALKADGHLVAWNDGVGSQHNVPTRPITNVLDIAAGSYHGAVLVGDGAPQPLWYLSNQVAIAGDSVTFAGEALGTEPLSYQWLLNGTNLPGAINPTLTLSNISPARAGTYEVVVSNALGTMTNSGSSLFVLPFVFTTQPTNANLYGGDTFLNSISVNGRGLSYQWRHDGTDLPGQTNALLSLSDVTTNDAGAYSVVISNEFGTLESAAATLTVVPIVMVYPPQDGTVYVGQTTNLSVSAGMNGPFSYQWRKDGTDLPGENNQFLTLTNLTLQQAGGYSVRVSNPYGSIESPAATLTVLDSAPILLSQPRDAGIWPGGSVSFRVSADGSQPLAFQWRFNGTDIPGATNSSLGISAATINDVGAYSVLVSNALGTRFSTSAKLALVPVVIWPTELLSSMPLSPALSNTVAVSAGMGFNLAVKADGKVVAWGWNGEGETNVPPGLSNVIAVAAGDSHCLALRSNATVVAWGSNAYGQTNAPSGLSNVVAIAATELNSLALRSDGTAVAWGQLDYVRNTRAVPGMDWNGVTAVAAGQFHRLGLRPDGTVAAWLDYSDYSLNRVPTGLSNLVAVAAAARHSLALKADGTVVAWGDRANGLTNIPAALSNVVSIACGYDFNLALGADGSVAAWGGPSSERTNVPAGLGSFTAVSASLHNLGLLASSDPAIVRAPRPVTVPPLQPVLLSVGAVSRLPLLYQWQFNGENIPGATNAFYQVAAASQANQGIYRVVVGNELGVVITAPARLTVAGVLAWGANWLGQTNVPSGLNAVGIAAGSGHSLALRTDGRVVDWGRTSYAITNVPISVTNVIQIAAGPNHSLALKADGKVVAWGEGSSQLTVPSNLTNVVGVAAGQYQSYALKAGGSIMQWGSSAPVPAWLSNVVAISANYSAGLALRSDGIPVSWGTPPPQPQGLSNVVAVAAGNAIVGALKNDGTVVCWGNASPQAPADLTNAVAIAAGAGHFLALKSDGTVVAWGNNSNGQTNVPAGWTNVAAVAGGEAHSLVIVDSRDPLIVRQPTGAQAYSGNQVLFSVGARSGLPLKFQWQFNGTNLAGATDAWLLLPAVQAADVGLYSVAASNALGTVSSSPATLVVLDQKPFIRAQPANLTVDGGTPAVFQVIAEGSEPKAYRWRKDGSPLDGATNAALVISDPKRADEGLYSVVVSNAFGFVTSTQAKLRVMVPQQLRMPVLNSDGSIGLLFGDSDGGLLSSANVVLFGVEASTNLLDWELLTNALTLTNGMLRLSDDSATNWPVRFYRVREVP